MDTNEKIADLETKIVELEKQNAGLKNKVMISSYCLKALFKCILLVVLCPQEIHWLLKQRLVDTSLVH